MERAPAQVPKAGVVALWLLAWALILVGTPATFGSELVNVYALAVKVIHSMLAR